MKVEIITDSELLKRSLERYLEYVLPKIDFENLFLVDIFSGIYNFYEIKKIVEDEKNVIILIGTNVSKKDSDFNLLMSYKNVGFVNALRIHDILIEYQKIVSGNIKEDDKTAIALYEFESLERAISRLRHDLHYALDDELRFTNWIKRARNAGIIGTDKEIVSYVENFTPETSGKFQGKYLEGIFVDALDTLFDENWKVVEEVRMLVEELSKNTNKKITVISDSDENDVKEALENSKLSWKNISKFALRGAKLEIVFDNLSEEEFEKVYKISAGKFTQIFKI